MNASSVESSAARRGYVYREFGADSANLGLTALLPMESMNTHAWSWPIPCAILVGILRDHLGRLRR